jgi:DNA-binding MarR family transcriptional regulator
VTDDPSPSADEARRALESQLAEDIRALGAESERLSRVFAALNRVSTNDLHALRQIIVSERAGAPLSSGQLRERLGVSASAITYLVERMTAAGHIQRGSDPDDRRRVILRYDEHGIEVAQSFFRPLGAHNQAAMANFPDADLETAHRVLLALVSAIRAYYTELGDQSNR